jgi:excisionase family DNA binding protein
MSENQPTDPAPVFPEWMTVEQAAEWLQVSTKTIRRYIEGGSLPAVNLGGRAIRIRRPDLEEWLETRRIEPGVSLRRQEREERRNERRQRHPRDS